MKYLLVLLLPICAKSQYMNFSALGFSGDNIAMGGGAKLSFGIFNKGVGVGVGTGFLLYPTTVTYPTATLPIYFDISFIGKQGKISPYINASIGYGFSEYLQGLYSNFNAGIAFPTNKKSKIYLFAGAMPMAFKPKKQPEAEQIHRTFISFGVGLMGHK